jgi:WD40 repeat protein
VNRDLAASCSTDKTLKVWNIAESSEIPAAAQVTDWFFGSVCFSADGSKLVATVSSVTNYKLSLWEPTSWELIMVADTGRKCEQVLFSNNGIVILSRMSASNDIALYESISGAKVTTLSNVANVMSMFWSFCVVDVITGSITQLLSTTDNANSGNGSFIANL